MSHNTRACLRAIMPTRAQWHSTRENVSGLKHLTYEYKQATGKVEGYSSGNI